MTFVKGKSGNPRGRPSGKTQDMTPAELKAILAKLKRASPEAVDLMIEVMQNDANPETTRLKYAEKIFAMYITALKEADRIKQANKPKDEQIPLDGEDEKETEPAVVLQLRVGGKKDEK